ncbi:MAG: hypothetical protein KFB93_07050 [Simkaniaceae bacterium]|jgi:hypothetical protein|nr:MAG: hypothetical protein KFB93_07050 [Simkaniaceae bacterium]
MGMILKSTWEGMGTLGLYSICEAKRFPHPKMLDSFVYGTALSLTCRFIEHQGKSYYEKRGKLCVIVVISLKILSPYLLREFLEKGLDIEISTRYIQLENGLYFLALLDGEFEYLEKQMDSVRNRKAHRWRITANLIHLIERRYRSLFD